MTSVLRGIPAYRARSYIELERIARDVRKCVAPRTALDEPIDAIKLFERLDDYSVTVRRQPVKLSYAVEDLPAGLEAHARFAADTKEILVVLDCETYSELVKNRPRAVFTLAHEIGHAVLHANELLDRALNPPDTSGLNRAPSHKSYNDTEWQANGFAGALLMPARGLRVLEQRGTNLDAFVLSEQYAVSMQAAEIRLKTYLARKQQLL